MSLLDNVCVFDIETIPTQREDLKAEIEKSVSPPGNIKKQETIDAWMNGEGKYEGEREKAIDEKYRKTALDGSYGEIVSIAHAFSDGEISTITRPIDGSEADLLGQFWDAIGDGNIRWCGHNITGFDLRFLFQRSVIQQVKIADGFPHDAKPWDKRVYDTAYMWGGTNYVSMQKLCTVLGIPGKGDIDGSMVWDEMLAGHLEKIAEYNAADVERTREMFKRIMFLS